MTRKVDDEQPLDLESPIEAFMAFGNGILAAVPKISLTPPAAAPTTPEPTPDAGGAASPSGAPAGDVQLDKAARASGSFYTTGGRCIAMRVKAVKETR